MKRFSLVMLSLLFACFYAFSASKLATPAAKQADVAASTLQSIEGIISKIKMTGPDLEIAFIKVDGKILEFTLDSKTKIWSKNGETVVASSLKKGERVKIDFRKRGRYDFARRIRIIA